MRIMSESGKKGAHYSCVPWLGVRRIMIHERRIHPSLRDNSQQEQLVYGYLAKHKVLRLQPAVVGKPIPTYRLSTSPPLPFFVVVKA